jgi:hypothetical protein
MRFFACSLMCPISKRVVSGVYFKNSIFIGRQNRGEDGLGFFQTIPQQHNLLRIIAVALKMWKKYVNNQLPECNQLKII